MVKVFRNGKHNKMNLEFEGREKGGKNNIYICVARFIFIY